MVSKVESSRIPSQLREKAKECVNILISTASQENYFFPESCIQTIGYDKKYGITVTCLTDEREGCVVCEKKHKTLQFRISLKTSRVTVHCRKTRKTHPFVKPIFCSSEEEDEKKIRIPKSVKSFVSQLLLLRLEHRVRTKAFSCKDEEEKASLLAPFEKGGIAADWSSLSAKAVAEMRSRITSPYLAVHQMFRLYKLLYKEQHPTTKVTFSSKKFGVYLDSLLCPIQATNHILAACLQGFDLDKSEFPVDVLTSEAAEQIRVLMEKINAS